MKNIRIGMVSFAHMHAVSYLRALCARDDVELAGIWDEQHHRVKPYCDEYAIPFIEDIGDLFALSIDAVVICSENAKHAEFIKLAAMAGKHVLCEKPLGISEEEMLGMIEVCKQHGVQLMTAFPCRYSPAVIEAKQAIESGTIGEIIAIKGTNRGTMPSGWFLDGDQSGGGAVLDHTVHVMDLMHWFTGSVVEEVFAYTETLYHDVEIDDAGMVHVRFRNGVFAVLDPSWSRSKSFPTWGDVTMQIIGTKGVLELDAFAQSNELYSDEASKAQWSYWGDSMDVGLIDSFVTSLKEGKDVAITGEDGYRSARVALAAYRSSSQCKPIQLEG